MRRIDPQNGARSGLEQTALLRFGQEAESLECAVRQQFSKPDFGEKQMPFLISLAPLNIKIWSILCAKYTWNSKLETGRNKNYFPFDLRDEATK